MIKIAEVVEQLVRQSPFISEAINDGLINVSALARRLQTDVEKQLGKPVKSGAIIMAINRLQTGELMFIEKNIRQFFQQLSDISVRSNLSDYTFQNSDTLLQKQVRLLAMISQDFPNAFYSFSQGVGETTIIVTNSLDEQVDQIFEGEKQLDKESQLSAITLMLPIENRNLYGVYYYILKDLAWQGINLVELISTSNEFTLIVSDEDLDHAFSVIMGLRKA